MLLRDSSDNHLTDRHNYYLSQISFINFSTVLGNTWSSSASMCFCKLFVITPWDLPTSCNGYSKITWKCHRVSLALIWSYLYRHYKDSRQPLIQL